MEFTNGKMAVGKDLFKYFKRIVKGKDEIDVVNGCRGNETSEYQGES